MFFFSSRRRHTRFDCDWSSDVCSSDLKGADSAQNTWNMDGVNITDMGATGSSPLYFDFDSFEEMQITTGGSDPRIQTPGVQLNMVTKRGTNDWRGSGRYFYTPGSYQADAEVPGE